MIILENDSVTIFQSALYQTVSTVIKGKDAIIVVDPCWLPFEVEEIRSYVESIIDHRPLYLLFTHSDFDHIIGYKAFPTAKVIASTAFVEKSKAEKQAIIEEIKAFDDDFYLVRDYEIAYPTVDFKPIKDGDALSIGDLTLVFYNAPGHTDDGLITVVEPLGLLIAGDYFSDIEFPFIYHSSTEYEETLLKLDNILHQHAIKFLITGHGNYTDKLAEMKKRQQASLGYIHKMRELVKAGDQEGIDYLIADYPFPRNMRKSHKDNQILFEKELNALERS